MADNVWTLGGKVVKQRFFLINGAASLKVKIFFKTKNLIEYFNQSFWEQMLKTHRIVHVRPQNCGAPYKRVIY